MATMPSVWKSIPPLLLLAWVFSACTPTGSDQTVMEEVRRLQSPDGAFDAILLQSSGDATTSYRYDILVVPHGQAARESEAMAMLYGALLNPRAYGVRLAWSDPNTLNADYWRAKSVKINTEKTQLKGRHIALTLREGIQDAAAPAGPMRME